MGGVRVEKLKLALIAADAARPDEVTLREGSENAFIPRVLSAMHKRLEQSFGAEAIIEIAALKFRCRLRQGDMAQGQFAESLGQDLATQVASSAKHPIKGKAGQMLRAPVQVYRNAPQQAAVRLMAATYRQKDSAGVRQLPINVLRDIQGSAALPLQLVLEHVYKLDGLDDLLRILPLKTLKDIEKGSALRFSPVLQSSLKRAIKAATLQEAQRRAASDQPAEDRPTNQRNPQGQPDSDAAKPATDEMDGPPHAPKSIQDEIAAPAPPDAEPPDQTQTGEPEKPKSRTGTPDRADEKPFQKASKINDTSQSDLPLDSDKPLGARDTQTTLGPAILSSNWCGLFYLLNVANQLGFPEHLWKIGQPEGDVLSAIFAHVSGDDSAGHCLSPRFPEPVPPLSNLQGWAWDELERALYATPQLSDAKDRVTAVELLLRGKADLSVATWGAAALIVSTERILDVQFTPDRIQDTFALRGQIVVDDDTITVIQPIEAIDIEIRKAGLDADPGWLPWIKKKLRFTFVSPDGPS